MDPSVYKSASRIKCPVCNHKFIPAYYHLEKIDYVLENNHHNFKIMKHKTSNGDLKPKNVVRKSWITNCPKCFYVLRFAAELGKKRFLNGDSSIFHLKEFKENNKWFKYEYESIKQPVDELATHNKKYLKIIENNIVEALEGLNLFKWGILYKKWMNDFSIDSFKFLIRFCHNFDNYCEELYEWASTQGIEYKIETLNLSDELKETMVKIEKLRLDSMNKNYELNKKDEEVIRKAFLKLMFELIYNRLKDLELDQLCLLEFYDDYDKEILTSKVKRYIEKYIEGNLGLGIELENFMGALFRKLSLPPSEIQYHYNAKQIITKIFKK